MECTDYIDLVLRHIALLSLDTTGPFTDENLKHPGAVFLPLFIAFPP